MAKKAAPKSKAPEGAGKKAAAAAAKKPAAVKAAPASKAKSAAEAAAKKLAVARAPASTTKAASAPAPKPGKTLAVRAKRSSAPALRHLPPGTKFFELSRLMVVALDGGSKLVQKAQSGPNGPWAKAWSPIAPGTYAIMATGLTRDGRVAVVAQPSGGPQLVFITEDANQVGPVEKWNAPVNIGAVPGAAGYQSMSMARDADGLIEVFVVTANGQIWWIRENPPKIVDKRVTITPPGTDKPITVTVQEQAPPDKPWSDWQQIPGSLVAIVARRQGDGRIVLFGINSTLNLYRCQQSVARTTAVGQWTPWVMMNTPTTGTFIGMAPVLGPSGALNFFGLTNNGQVVHTRQQPAGSETWTPWATPGFSRTGINTLASGIQGDNDIVLVASDHSLIHQFNAQNSARTRELDRLARFLQIGRSCRVQARLQCRRATDAVQPRGRSAGWGRIVGQAPDRAGQHGMGHRLGATG
ncbi:hypothetical protein ACHMW7_02375 (plasmid) [Aminobacter sp. UC22_36]|uniref:hypothetical protein n=1 Tax=Aminobacter sp. UC22_36 TaxID=3374549 RepID=UPI00375733F2